MITRKSLNLSIETLCVQQTGDTTQLMQLPKHKQFISFTQNHSLTLNILFDFQISEMFSVTLLLSRNQQLTALLKKKKKNEKNKAIKNKTQFISNQLLLCYGELYIYMAREHKSLENESLKKTASFKWFLCRISCFNYIWGSDSQCRQETKSSNVC